MVSVLPPGIDVRKLQRSHSRDKSARAFIRFTKPSFFRFTYPVYLSDLACSHQTLSDISLDRSEVKSDKLLDVNAARYEGLLQKSGLTTLQTRRLRGDQIEVFKAAFTSRSLSDLTSDRSKDMSDKV